MLIHAGERVVERGELDSRWQLVRRRSLVQLVDQPIVERSIVAEVQLENTKATPLVRLPMKRPVPPVPGSDDVPSAYPPGPT